MASVKSPGSEFSYAGPAPFLLVQQLGWALLNSCSAPSGSRGDNCQLRSAAVPVPYSLQTRGCLAPELHCCRENSLKMLMVKQFLDESSLLP